MGFVVEGTAEGRTAVPAVVTPAMVEHSSAIGRGGGHTGCGGGLIGRGGAQRGGGLMGLLGFKP